MFRGGRSARSNEAVQPVMHHRPTPLQTLLSRPLDRDAAGEDSSTEGTAPPGTPPSPLLMAPNEQLGHHATFPRIAVPGPARPAASALTMQIQRSTPIAVPARHNNSSRILAVARPEHTEIPTDPTSIIPQAVWNLDDAAVTRHVHASISRAMRTPVRARHLLEHLKKGGFY